MKSLSYFEDSINDRLSLDGSRESLSSVRSIDPVSAPEPELISDPVVTYNDAPVPYTQRVRSSNLPAPTSEVMDKLNNIYSSRSQEIQQPVKSVSTEKKYLFVNMPESLLGIKLQEGETFAGNLFSNAISGAGLGGVFGGVGSVVGAIGGIGKAIFGGRKQTKWFDVIYKDAMKEAFEGMGLKINHRPFGGSSLTVKSQFGIESKISLSDMRSILGQFNSRLATEFSQKQRIVSGLSQVSIEDRYDKRRTLFRFAVQNETTTQPENSVSSSSVNKSPVKATLGVATVIGILLSLR